MRFPKSQIFFQEISRKDLEALLGHPLYALCRTLAGKGYLCDLGPQAGCPKRKSLCVARDMRPRSQTKPAVARGEKHNPPKSWGRLPGPRLNYASTTFPPLNSYHTFGLTASPSTLTARTSMIGFVSPSHSPRSVSTSQQPSAPRAFDSLPVTMATDSLPETSAAERLPVLVAAE